MKVLVVDDDPIVCAILADALEKLGVEHVLVAQDGEDAAWLFTENEYDIPVIICDLNMPRLNGIEFVQFLSGRMSEPCIVFVSGAHATIRNSAVALAEACNLCVI